MARRRRHRRRRRSKSAVKRARPTGHNACTIRQSRPRPRTQFRRPHLPGLFVCPYGLPTHASNPHGSKPTIMLSARSTTLSASSRGASARRAAPARRTTSVRVRAVLDVTPETWEKEVLKVRIRGVGGGGRRRFSSILRPSHCRKDPTRHCDASRMPRYLATGAHARRQSMACPCLMRCRCRFAVGTRARDARSRETLSTVWPTLTMPLFSCRPALPSIHVQTHSRTSPCSSTSGREYDGTPAARFFFSPPAADGPRRVLSRALLPPPP